MDGREPRALRPAQAASLCHGWACLTSVRFADGGQSKTPWTWPYLYPLDWCGGELRIQPSGLRNSRLTDSRSCSICRGLNRRMPLSARCCATGQPWLWPGHDGGVNRTTRLDRPLYLLDFARGRKNYSLGNPERIPVSPVGLSVSDAL